MKRCWKQKKTVKKSVNLRANFDKNKKASRIKALREFTMKRLADFFEEKDWKNGKRGYNEKRKRSKYCGYTVSMRDWNNRSSRKYILYPYRYTVSMRDWNDLRCLIVIIYKFVEPYLWEIIYFYWTYCFLWTL